MGNRFLKPARPLLAPYESLGSPNGLDYARRAPFRRLEISFSHGGEWKALISKYIGTIPVSGDASCVAEQSMSGMLPPWTAVSSAMIAKVGVVARDSKQAALALVRFRSRAMSASTKSIMSEIIGASPLSVASILVVPANPIHPEVRRCGGRTQVSGPKSAPAGSQVVRMPGLQARPLGGGTSIGTGNLLALKPLWPAGRRVLPRLLPPVDGHVEQPVAVIHRLDAAYRRPVSLEDIGSFSEVANDVHHAHPASNQEGVERALGRVPRHLPAHEVAVPGALFVRALAKRGVGDVARMNIGQLADLRCNPGAPLALLRRRVAGLPHEVVGDEHPASLKHIQCCDRPTFANERCGTVHLDHWEPSAGGCNGVALSCVSLLSNPQCVQLGEEGAPIDYLRGSKFISHEVCHRSLR